jgi:hypothetical protein
VWASIAAAAAGTATLATLSVWFGGTWFRFARYHRHKGLDLPDGDSWGERLGAWANESTALMQVLLYKVEAAPRRLVAPADPGPPVLCVHGFTQDRTNFGKLRRTLWDRGRPSEAIDLGLPGRHPSAYAPRLIAALEEIEAEHPHEPVDVVCHSMGGVLLRHVLVERPDLAARIGTIVTLGSPHHGTAASRGFRFLPEAVGLNRRSPWISGLPTFAELAPHARSVTVGGSADYVVYPLETCHLEGSERVDLRGLGHAGMLTHPRSLAVIVAALDGAPLPDVAQPSSAA